MNIKKNLVIKNLFSILVAITFACPLITVYASNNKLPNKELQDVNKNFDFDANVDNERNFSINVNEIATSQSKARGTITESVGSDNKPYPIKKIIEDKKTYVKKDGVREEGLGENNTERPKANAREFLTFETKSGKVFHLIIDHDKESDNVSLVTEVSESDLLNMIEGDNKKPTILKDNEIKKEEPKVDIKEDKKTEPKKNSLGSFIIFGVIIAIVLGLGYYFKIVKPNLNSEVDEEVDVDALDDDFFVNDEDNQTKESDASDLDKEEDDE